MWPDRVSNPGPLTYESGATNCATLPGQPRRSHNTDARLLIVYRMIYYCSFFTLFNQTLHYILKYIQMLVAMALQTESITVMKSETATTYFPI